MLTKEEIQSQDSSKNLGFALLPVPSLTEPLRIKRLTLGDKQVWRGSMMDEAGEFDREKLKTTYAALAALCVVDESGVPIFTEAEILALSPVVGEPIMAEAKRINGIGQEAVKEQEKN